MRLDPWAIELKHSAYIRKIIRSKLPWADEDRQEKLYTEVMRGVRAAGAKGYELRGEYGIKSLKHFLKVITWRRIVDYLRRKTSEERRLGKESYRVDADVYKLGEEDADIRLFLKQGPCEHVHSIGGVEVEPILDKLRNKQMWTAWAVQNELSREKRKQIIEARFNGEQLPRGTPKTPAEIRQRIAEDWGISPEAVRLRLYRGRKKFRTLWDRERRLRKLRRERDIALAIRWGKNNQVFPHY